MSILNLREIANNSIYEFIYRVSILPVGNYLCIYIFYIENHMQKNRNTKKIA